MSDLTHDMCSQIVEAVFALPDEYREKIIKETKKVVRTEIYKEMKKDVAHMVLALPKHEQGLVLDDCRRQIAEDIATDISLMLSGETHPLAEQINTYIFKTFLSN